MTWIKDPTRVGFARDLWREYRRLRRDQAPHHPDLTMRMDRRHALAIAWHNARQMDLVR